MKRICISIILLFTAALAGCVERFITVTSRPEGAAVWLNDEEVGSTPLTVPFTWYGEYEVVLRKEGYQTIKTSRQADAPLYQWPVIDLAAELLPMKLVDKHQWDFDLTVQPPADPDQLMERARELQAQTLADPG